MTHYRTQATRPDYSEPKEKVPTKSFKEVWEDFKSSRRNAINGLSGWKKTVSMVAHGAALIFGFLLLPIFLFAILAHFFGSVNVGAVLLLMFVIGAILVSFLVTADVVFDL